MSLIEAGSVWKGKPGEHVGLQQCLGYSTSIGYLAPDEEKCTPAIQPLEHGISRELRNRNKTKGFLN